MSDVLVVTTSVGMLDGVHTDTSHLGPHLSLGFGLEVLGSSLQEGPFVSSSSSNDADHGSGASNDGSSDTTGQLDSGLGAVFALADDGGEGYTGSGELSSVSGEVLNVADDGSFRDFAHRQHVSDVDPG